MAIFWVGVRYFRIYIERAREREDYMGILLTVISGDVELDNHRFCLYDF